MPNDCKLGLIVIDSVMTLLPGSPGNARSYDVPVDYELARGVTGERCIEGSPDVAEALRDAARQLERRGSTIIASNCGFLGRYQGLVASAVSVPVCLSAMSMLPTLEYLVATVRKIGIVTFSKRGLSLEMIRACGFTGDIGRLVVSDVERIPSWGVLNSAEARLDPAAMEADLQGVVESLLQEHSDLGSIIFECTAMSPFVRSLHFSRHVFTVDNTSLIRAWISCMVPFQYQGVRAPPTDAGIRVASLQGV